MARAAWRHADEPRGAYAHTYWLRMRAMGVDVDSVGDASISTGPLEELG